MSSLGPVRTPRAWHPDMEGARQTDMVASAPIPQCQLALNTTALLGSGWDRLEAEIVAFGIKHKSKTAFVISE